jgi:hypothetical protein
MQAVRLAHSLSPVLRVSCPRHIWDRPALWHLRRFSAAATPAPDDAAPATAANREPLALAGAEYLIISVPFFQVLR